MTTRQSLPSYAPHTDDQPDQSVGALSLGQSRAGRAQGSAAGAEDQQEALGLAADIEYDVHEGVLRILVEGPLDLRCTSRLLAIGQAVDESITACRLSLGGVTRVFDSKIAALILLAKALTRKGVGLRIEGLDLDRPNLSPYHNPDRRPSVSAYLRRVFTWSPPSLFDTDPMVMPIRIPVSRPK